MAPSSPRPPFRADHVGSLLRPPTLRALRLEHQAGRAPAGALRAAEDAAICDVVAVQESAGLQGIIDVALRRKSSLHRTDIRDILEKAARGEAFALMDRVRYRRDKAFAVRLCVQAVNRLFEASGARAVLDSDPIQRFHRDVHGASHHAALGWDVAAEQFGREALGRAPSNVP